MCGLFGHHTEDCKREESTGWKRKRNAKDSGGRASKKPRKEQSKKATNEVHIVEVRDPHEDEEEIKIYTGDEIDPNVPFEEQLIF